QSASELTSKIEAFPRQIKTLQDQLKEFLAHLDERKARQALNQKERRELDGEVQSIKVKIDKHREQLYQVKTNEQYRAMVKEIEGEEQNIREKEDAILEKMVEAEQIDKTIHDAGASLAGEKQRVEEDVRELESARRADEEEKERLLARRQELVGSVKEDLLAHYERLRRARHGIATAEVRDGLCTGCHVLLRPQAYYDIRARDILLTCENCSRFLYYIPASEHDDPGAAVASESHPAAQN
ncbi:MAG: zinc ribbon domain-containing protein, partial [Terriglobia bacterium]